MPSPWPSAVGLLVVLSVCLFGSPTALDTADARSWLPDRTEVAGAVHAALQTLHQGEVLPGEPLESVCTSGYRQRLEDYLRNPAILQDEVTALRLALGLCQQWEAEQLQSGHSKAELLALARRKVCSGAKAWPLAAMSALEGGVERKHVQARCLQLARLVHQLARHQALPDVEQLPPPLHRQLQQPAHSWLTKFDTALDGGWQHLQQLLDAAGKPEGQAALLGSVFPDSQVGC